MLELETQLLDNNQLADRTTAMLHRQLASLAQTRKRLERFEARAHAAEGARAGRVGVPHALASPGALRPPGAWDPPTETTYLARSAVDGSPRLVRRPELSRSVGALRTLPRLPAALQTDPLKSRPRAGDGQP